MNVSRQLAVLDRVAALTRVGGDEELLREMAQLFLEEYPSQLEEVRAAVVRGDAKAIERTAHSLKGSVGNFGADAAHHAAYALELLGRQGNLAQVPAALRELEQALSSLHPAMEQLAEG